MTLTVLRSSGQVFCRMSIKFSFDDGFLMARLTFWFLEEDHRGKESFSILIISRMHGINMTHHSWCGLEHLVEAVFVKFFPCKVIFPSPSWLLHGVMLPPTTHTPRVRQSICIHFVKLLYRDLSILFHLFVHSIMNPYQCEYITTYSKIWVMTQYWVFGCSDCHIIIK